MIRATIETLVRGCCMHAVTNRDRKCKYKQKAMSALCVGGRVLPVLLMMMVMVMMVMALDVAVGRSKANIRIDAFDRQHEKVRIERKSANTNERMKLE
jgi:hypothetical protein